MIQSDSDEKLSSILIINDISKMFHDNMRDTNSHPEMKRGFAHLLYYIYLKDGRTQLELANLTLIRASTVSVTLKNMERAGLITRKTDLNDCRQTQVFITESGKELHKFEKEKRKQLENIIFDGLSNEELENLHKMLIHIKNNLKKERE
jgi:DNA-binding MarR family transcriptional regulator